MRSNPPAPGPVSASDITRHHEADPRENPWVDGTPWPETAVVVRANPDWPARYAEAARQILETLEAASVGTTIVCTLEHVGSTAVPGLAAKDVIDIDLTVGDPTDEASYVPALVAIGYTHVIREPSWHEHRMLRLAEPRVNLHVFGRDCPELIRHRLFRDWLIEHPADRQRYESAKFAAAASSVDGVQTREYNAAKERVIHEIYGRAFLAAGLI
ncbi:GrpB family protein [Lysinibacter cavernae]|uniref:GrpB-like predicted nucleotidyltransferase (UPF0157 family) n=1 Tax=Lysinibacter cavernae TaxID=1640652 RepID=A0A7X5QZ26_9MICO|nr:GrpB-like predicted nucleotidyltransferase (UPF0157 family) [Lysinibacter cavernae]